MIQNKSVLVTICARGGSKGIPGKNLKMLGGKPLIQWTLDLLPQIKYTDKWMFSSDSDEYGDYVLEHSHAQYTRHRPAELATDTVSRVEAIKDAVLFTERAEQKTYDIIVDLGVCTPFKTAADVNDAIEIMESNHRSHLVSATNTSHSPYFDMVERIRRPFPLAPILRVVKDCFGSFSCRQETPPVWLLNDAINIWTREALCAHKGLEEDSILFQMPPERSIHLDSNLDWLLAETVLKEKLI